MKSFAVAICAPSGTGKTTVARALVRGGADLLFSVSATTRPARVGEQAGVDGPWCGVARICSSRSLPRHGRRVWASRPVSTTTSWAETSSRR